MRNKRLPLTTTCPIAIETVAADKANPKCAVTDLFGFDDIQNAMDRSVADKANIVKAVVKIGRYLQIG